MSSQVPWGRQTSRDSLSVRSGATNIHSPRQYWSLMSASRSSYSWRNIALTNGNPSSFALCPCSLLYSASTAYTLEQNTNSLSPSQTCLVCSGLLPSCVLKTGEKAPTPIHLSSSPRSLPASSTPATLTHTQPPTSQWLLAKPTSPELSMAVRQLGRPLCSPQFMFWSPAQREWVWGGEPRQDERENVKKLWEWGSQERAWETRRDHSTGQRLWRGDWEGGQRGQASPKSTIMPLAPVVTTMSFISFLQKERASGLYRSISPAVKSEKAEVSNTPFFASFTRQLFCLAIAQKLLRQQVLLVTSVSIGLTQTSRLIPLLSRYSLISLQSGYPLSSNSQFHHSLEYPIDILLPTQSCSHTPATLPPASTSLCTIALTLPLPPCSPSITPLFTHSGSGCVQPLTLASSPTSSLQVGRLTTVRVSPRSHSTSQFRRQMAQEKVCAAQASLREENQIGEGEQVEQQAPDFPQNSYDRNVRGWSPRPTPFSRTNREQGRSPRLRYENCSPRPKYWSVGSSCSQSEADLFEHEIVSSAFCFQREAVRLNLSPKQSSKPPSIEITHSCQVTLVILCWLHWSSTSVATLQKLSPFEATLGWAEQQVRKAPSTIVLPLKVILRLSRVSTSKLLTLRYCLGRPSKQKREGLLMWDRTAIQLGA